MVNCDLIVVAKTTEERAVVGDFMVQILRYLDCLTLLFFKEREDVFLGFLGGVARSSDLDIGVVRALSRNVQIDVELRLQSTSGLATTADEQAVLTRRNLDGYSDLVFSFLHKGLNGRGDLIDHIGLFFKFDSAIVTVWARKLHCSDGITIARTAGIRNNLPNVGTYTDGLDNLDQTLATGKK